MDIPSSGTGNTFTLPVALIFQNVSGLDENDGFIRGNISSAIASDSNQSWKKDIYVNGAQRMEKMGDVLRRELKWAFILHNYGFGCIFFILAFYTFFSVLNIRSFISTRPFMSTINGFLCLLGTSRAASLFIDPYNLKENMPKLIGQVLWDIGFPSLISAFCLVQLAFIQLTQLRVGPEGLRRKSCLSLVVTAHFLLTIGMDIIVASNENFMAVKLVVQYIFLTWGVFLCSNFLYSGYKIMSVIRNMPDGLKNKDLLDSNYKGIMQLAILAPRNHLAGSMTAALIPTLCAPKIHQQDSSGLSAVGFRHEGNSRILESESIPMLEEMATSSGDEANQKPLARGSSFQNQTRNTPKFNLKPKLSLKSMDREGNEDDLGDGKSKSPKPATPKLAQGRVEFDFNAKPSGGILKNNENPAAPKSIYEYRTKISEKTSFENETFHFGNGKKPNLVDDDLISGTETDSDRRTARPGDGDRNASSALKEKMTVLMKEMKDDLNDMRILREGKNCGSEEFVEIHNPKKHRAGPEKVQPCKLNQRRGSPYDDGQISNGENRTNCRETSESEAPFEGRGSPSSDIQRISKLEQAPIVCQKLNRRKKMKSLSWKKKDSHEEDEENATHECLLPQDNSTDLSFKSMLNHITYTNRCPETHAGNEDHLEKERKSKVEWVLNVTYVTAMCGLMLCLSNMGRIYSPFGETEPSKVLPSSNSTNLIGKTDSNENGIFSSWPWLWFQTFCRALELAMGCAMANITRQPAANHRYPRMFGLRHRDAFYAM